MLDRGGDCSGGGNAIVVGVSMGVSQYGQICQSVSSGALHVAHACRSFVVQTGQTRNESSISARHTGH